MRLDIPGSGPAGAILAVTIAGCALVLGAAAIWNGYPLVFPDTGVYLAQALEVRGDPSRPPFYSLFLLPLHTGISLWPVVFVQGGIAAGMICLTARTALGRQVSPAFLFVVVCVLSLLSSLPWHTGQILPDLFTSLLVLAVYVTVFGWNDLARGARLFTAGVLLACTAFHYSHLPLLALTGGVALAWAAWRQRSLHGLWRPFCVIAGGGLLAGAAFVSYNYVYAGRASLSLDGSKFLLARLIGDGTAVKFLQQACPTGGFALCGRMDGFQGDHNTFLWSEASPWRYVEQERGFLGARDEAAAVVRGTLRQFPLEQAGRSFTNLKEQLVSFGTADTLCPCVGDSLVNRVIARHFPGEHASYLDSRQSRGPLPVAAIRAVHGPLVALSLVGCLAFLASLGLGRNACGAAGERLGNLLLVIAVGVVANAIITGVLSGPADRYGSRVIWLVVFAFLLVAFALVRRGGQAAPPA